MESLQSVLLTFLDLINTHIYVGGGGLERPSTVLTVFIAKNPVVRPVRFYATESP